MSQAMEFVFRYSVCHFQAGSTKMIKNFNEDIKDSEIYTDVIAQVAPTDAAVNKFAMKKEVIQKSRKI
jgi:hypothetical protein